MFRYNVDPEGTPLAPEDPVAEGIIIEQGPEDDSKKE